MALTATQRASGAYRRCYKLCVKLLKASEYPSPTRINRELRPALVKSNTINGVEAQARIQALQEFGYVMGPKGRYVKADPLEGLRKENWKNLKGVEAA